MNQTAIACIALLAATPALAQEMLNMPAATAPSPGVAIPRVQARAFLFEDSQWLLEQTLRLEYGIARDLSIAADLPLQQGFFDAPRPTDGDFALGTASEAELLRLLMSRVDRVVSKEELRTQVFADTGDQQVQADAVEVVVHRLRKKLVGTNAEIVTLRGVGYLLCDGDSMAAHKGGAPR